jgi:hypothetical protein
VHVISLTFLNLRWRGRKCERGEEEKTKRKIWTELEEERNRRRERERERERERGLRTRKKGKNVDSIKRSQKYRIEGEKG